MDNIVLPSKLFSFACLSPAGKFPGGKRGGGRSSHMKRFGMLVRKSELTPKEINLGVG